MARVTKKSFLKLTPSEIGKMKSPELRELLRGARNLFSQQSKTFEKYSDKIYSHSYEKMREYYRDHGREKVEVKGGVESYSTVPERMNKMSINQMRNEVFRLQEFFDSKTSTVPGTRQVTSDMAKRIFGETKSGRPKKNLSVDEWRDFWSIYDEYKRQRPADTITQSNVVQQLLGQMMVDSLKTRGLSLYLGQSVIDELRDLIEDRRKRENWEMDVSYEGTGSVFTGNRPD
jgi:hypothetical protein